MFASFLDNFCIFALVIGPKKIPNVYLVIYVLLPEAFRLAKIFLIVGLLSHLEQRRSDYEMMDFLLALYNMYGKKGFYVYMYIYMGRRVLWRKGRGGDQAICFTEN